MRVPSFAMGAVAILLWSGTVGLARSLSERLGPLTAGACAYGAGGVLGVAWLAARGRLRAALGAPRAYLLACGGLFVAYTACLFLALGRAAGRQQALEVGVLNYLWPALTVLFSLPILGARARPVPLVLGLLLGAAGAALAFLRPGQWSAAAFARALSGNPGPYALAAAGGVLWALYSNLSRRLGGAAAAGAVPLFALLTAAALAGLRLAMPEPSRFSGAAWAELAFVALFPTLIAYSLWDAAMRRGDVPRIAALSYFAPVLATAIGAVYLGVTPGWNLWAAAGALLLGALLCDGAVRRGPVRGEGRATGGGEPEGRRDGPVDRGPARL